MQPARSARLILIVDPDLDFVEDTRSLLRDERVLTARSLDEAFEIAVGGRLDLVVLGPSFGTEQGVMAAADLHRADLGLPVVLAANVVTNRILRAALKVGFVDVIDTPVTARKLTEAMSGVPRRDDRGRVAVVIEPPVESADRPAPAAAAAWDRPGPAAAPAAPGRESSRDILIETSPVSAPPPPAGYPAPGPESVPPPQPDPQSPEAVIGFRPEQPAPGPLPPDPPPPQPPIYSPPGSAPAASVAPQSSPLRVPPPLDALPDPPALSPPMPAGPPPTPDAEPAASAAEAPGLEALMDQFFGPESQPGPRGGGRFVAVMAGKGGSGKTITAVNLAVALAESGAGGVALVDADLQFGDVALLLQLDPKATVADAAGRVDELSDAALDALMMSHESGVRVLPAPLLPVTSDEVPAKHVVHVIQRLQHLYEYIVVDTAPVFDDQLLEVIAHADDVLLVVDMDLPSVKNARIALDTLRHGGFPMERLRLVVNRVNSKARLDLVELERSLGMRIFGSIPSDRLIPQSVNEGIPAIALAPKSKVGKAFAELAAAITGVQEPGRSRRR